MSNTVIKTLEEERNELIVISKEFVSRTRINFSRSEILALYFILKKIDPKQGNFSEISFSTSEFIRVLDLEKGGRQYLEAKKTLMSIKNKGFWMKVEGQTKEIAISFFDYLEVDTDTKLFTVRMNEQLMPFFLQLKDSIEFPLRSALEMKNVYCYPILMHLIMPRIEEKAITFTVDEIKDRLAIPKSFYNEFYEFRRCVLNKAIKGINDVTGLAIEIKSHTTAGKVTHITFIINGELNWNYYLQ